MKEFRRLCILKAFNLVEPFRPCLPQQAATDDAHQMRFPITFQLFSYVRVRRIFMHHVLKLKGFGEKAVCLMKTVASETSLPKKPKEAESIKELWSKLE